MTEYHYRVFGVNANDGVTLKAETFGTTAASASGLVLSSTAGASLMSEAAARSFNAIASAYSSPTLLLATDRARHRAFDEFVVRWDSSEQISRNSGNLAAITDARRKVDNVDASESVATLSDKPHPMLSAADAGQLAQPIRDQLTDTLGSELAISGQGPRT
jgi:hypothetical protein